MVTIDQCQLEIVAPKETKYSKRVSEELFRLTRIG